MDRREYRREWERKNRDRTRVRQRAYRAAHYEQFRRSIELQKDKGRQYLLALKQEPCQDCGGRFPPECMDFDHARGEKRHHVGKMTGHSLAKIAEEVEKCDLVCANCHRIRTVARRRARATAAA